MPKSFKIFLYCCLTLSLLAGIWQGCRPNESDYLSGAEVQLRFSADTVFFDTLFTEIPSITKRLRVYNDRDRPLIIDQITLADPDTPYRITVNGRQGTSFSEVRILARDSILILLEALLPARDSLAPFVVEGRLIFNPQHSSQEVIILSWGQDAHYLKDTVLACNTTWTTGKPYVLFGSVLVDSLCTLTLEAGTQVYAHNNATLYIGGRLQVNGTADKRVLFTNDRLDEPFASAPGQWNGLVFLPGSNNNTIQFADIRNAVNGIWLGTPDNDTLPDLVLNNCRLENMLQSAVLAFTSDLDMTNCLLANSGQFVFAGLAGGHYRLTHNTLANYAIGLTKTQPVLAATDRLELNDGSVLEEALTLYLTNNIVWGLADDELVILNETTYPLLLQARNNLLRTTDDRFAGGSNILNADPLFVDPYLFNYKPDSLSPAIDAGLPVGITTDLEGNPRNATPDIGAYEYPSQ